MRCSLAFLEAFVSRANLGVTLFSLTVALGVACSLVASAFAELDWPWLSLLLSVLGTPRPEGCFTNLFSAEEDVGKSSKSANSEPSPKLRRRVGRVSVLLLAATNVSGLDSLRVLPVVSWRVDRGSRVPCP